MQHDPNDRAKGRIERVIADLVGRRSVWIVLMAVAAGLPLAKAYSIKLPPTPAKIRQIPNFTLMDQDGKPFGVEQLSGKLWVANFIFTSCQTVCPKLTSAMDRVRIRAKNMKGAVQFISFTVDPATDTIAVLDQYAQKHHARGDWNFLTGPVESVRNVVIDGFRIGMGPHNGAAPVNEQKESALESQKSNAAAELLSAAHGAQLVLVDKDMWVRGFYNPDKEGIDRLMFEMGLIANLEGVDLQGLDPTVPNKPINKHK
ncbi:MAG: SCO family protein [Planctomycetes bacterium]|nr:SCO family protein [Planctomycetota bacterium]